MESYIEQIQKSIEPLRQQIINHKVYAAIEDIDGLRMFMQYHAYAVWDFMSLLKSLQNNLTCTTVPWFPKGSPESRYLINEIVLGEESDVDMEGNRKSHFELYLEAMCQCGADTAQIQNFTAELMQSGNLNDAFQKAGTPEKAIQFVRNTFEIIRSNKDYVQAAVFTFGREDLIPDMFHSIINDLHAHFPERVSIFKYYLERHIEVDGDHHSHLALQMTSNLCGTNEEFWQEATSAVAASLQKRIELWDGVYDAIVVSRQVAV